MTTLADINQTLMVQNEMQEKTTKAVDSLTKRFAAFLRVSKGDKLEDLESRREARRQSRAMGFAGRAKGAASAVKNNIGLISKILGGLALTAFVLQNDELRAAVMDFITTAGEGIAAFFRSDEFREILGATFSAAGNVFTSILGTVWETPGGKQMLAGLGIALAAIFGGPALIAALAASLATSLLKLPFQAARTVTGLTGGGRGSVVEERGARAKAIAEQRRLAAERAKANAAQKRFTGNQTRLSTSQKLAQMASSTTLGQRVSNITRGVGRSVNAAAAPIARGVGRSVNAVAPIASGASRAAGAASLALPFFSAGLDRESAEAGLAYREALALNALGMITGLGDLGISGINLLADPFNQRDQEPVVKADLTDRMRKFLTPFLVPFSEASRARQAELDVLGRESLDMMYPDLAADVFAQRSAIAQNVLYPSLSSKIPALSQAMDGAGTGAPIVVPVPIPMDAGKGPGPAVVQGTVGGSLSAGETIHLNQDPGTIIGGVPRQQSGGGGGW